MLLAGNIDYHRPVTGKGSMKYFHHSLGETFLV